MEYVVRIKLDQEVIDALKRANDLKLHERINALAEDHYWLKREVHEVALAPDERARAINAGYGW